MYFKCNFFVITYKKVPFQVYILTYNLNFLTEEVHFKCKFKVITYTGVKKMLLISYTGNSIKKISKQNHKYDSAIDATPAPASSITPKPFKVIPIAAKVWVNSL